MAASGNRAAGWVAGVVVIGVLLPACTGTERSAPPGRSPDVVETTTRPDASTDFASAANGVCLRSEQRMDDVPAPGPPENWLDFGRRFERIFGDTLDGLTLLDPPRDLAGDYRTWLRKLRHSNRGWHALWRTVALRFPAVQSPDDRVNRAIRRSSRLDGFAGRFAQSRLTDLYSCYDVTPWTQARMRVTAACGGFLFCT